MLELIPNEQDDPQFVKLVTDLLHGAVQCYQPTEIYVVQIDNWFDHKWKGFSGVIDLQLGVWRGPTLTPPPFNPHRVMSHIHYQHFEAGYQVMPGWVLHRETASMANVNRYLKGFVGQASLLLWYSSATKVNDRASLMVYFIEQTEELAWYVSFSKQEEWRVHKSKGISRQELAGLVELSTKPSIS